MSGPKVIRIVTREELLERCGTAIARVDAAIARRTRVLDRNELLDASAESDATSRHTRISELLAADRFDEVQQVCKATVEWAEEDVQRHLDEQAVARAATGRARSTLKTAARILLEEVSSHPERLPADLLADLRASANDPASEEGQLQSVIARVRLQLGSARISDSAAASKRTVVEGLDHGARLESVDQWLSDRGLASTLHAEPKLEVLQQRVELLAVLADGEVARPFRERIDQLGNADASRRSLLRDSIAIQLARALQNARERNTLWGEVEALAAELQASGMMPRLGQRLDKLTEQIASGDLEAVQAGLKTLRGDLDHHTRQRTAESGREALLGGLRELGYEVHEGMATAWADEGRLVLRSSLRPQYGVELGGRGHSGRFQVRVVADGLAAPPVADERAESTWCSELARLRQRLADAGTQVDIERETPAGTNPVKRARLGSPREADARRDDEQESLRVHRADRD